jgi:hypothetical protein
MLKLDCPDNIIKSNRQGAYLRMYRLSRPIAELLTLTGEGLDPHFMRAVKDLTISERMRNVQRQRLDMALRGEKLDFAPINADTRWWFAERYHEGTLQKDLEGRDIDKILMCSLESVPLQTVEPLQGVSFQTFWEGPPVRYANEGFPGSKRTVTYTTPLGGITASEAYASRSFGVVEYPVKAVEDLKVVRYIYEQRAKNICGDLPATSWCAPMTPIQILIVHLAGIECASFLLADYQSEVEEFMDFLDEIHRPAIEYLARHNKLVFSVENYSADNSSGYFDQYLGPQLLKRSQIAEKYGAMIGVHHDGKLQPLFGRLRGAGVKYINGITAAPAGDVELEELRAIAGEDVILNDIIPQAIFMDEYDIGAFKEYIWRAAGFYKNDSRVIFGIGDMLPCISDIKRFEIMIDIIMKATNTM